MRYKKIKHALLEICYRACSKRRNQCAVMMEDELEADKCDNTRPSTSGK